MMHFKNIFVLAVHIYPFKLFANRLLLFLKLFVSILFVIKVLLQYLVYTFTDQLSRQNLDSLRERNWLSLLLLEFFMV